MADIPSLLSEGPENKCKALRDVVRGASARVGAGPVRSSLRTGVLASLFPFAFLPFAFTLLSLWVDGFAFVLRASGEGVSWKSTTLADMSSCPGARCFAFTFVEMSADFQTLLVLAHEFVCFRGRP